MEETNISTPKSANAISIRLKDAHQLTQNLSTAAPNNFIATFDSGGSKYMQCVQVSQVQLEQYSETADPTLTMYKNSKDSTVMIRMNPKTANENGGAIFCRFCEYQANHLDQITACNKNQKPVERENLFETVRECANSVGVPVKRFSMTQQNTHNLADISRGVSTMKNNLQTVESNTQELGKIVAIDIMEKLNMLTAELHEIKLKLDKICKTLDNKN